MITDHFEYCDVNLHARVICCFVLFRNYISYMLSITVLYLAFPVIILQSSYNAIYAYFKKTHHFKVLARS